MMMSDLVEYLKREKINNYRTEFPIQFGRNTGFIDVVIFHWDKMFLIDVKSGSDDFSGDIQQIKKYMIAIKKVKYYKWRDIYGFILYGNNLREKVLALKNLFESIDVLFFDENNNPVTLNGRKLKEFLSYPGKYDKLKMILRILQADFEWMD